jgi:hypothetical protein
VTVPYLVRTGFNFGSAGGWIDVEGETGGVWITANVLDEATPMSAVHVCHLDRGDPTKECRDNGASLGLHTRVSIDPLTITASLLCPTCGWHGWVTAGKWVPA